MAVQIQLRRGTAAAWTAANPVLASGELGLETDTGKVKLGNGSTTWSALSYAWALGSHGASHQHGGGDEVATATAAANAIPKAGAGATLASGWIPDLSGVYAIAAKGVTNGDAHDHVGGDGAQIDHGGLGGLADDDHPQYIKHSLATAINDFLVASGVGAFVKKTLDEVKAILGLGALAYKSTVATGDIDNDAVSYGKLQDISATDKVLGRVTAGAGDAEEIACTAAGRAILDDADPAAQRTTLGLGTAATKDVDAASGVAGLDASSRVTKNLFANFSNGDGVAWGIITTGTCGETLVAKDIVYGKAADARWWKARADVAATGGPVILAFVLSGGAAGASCTLLLWGTYGSTGWGLSAFAFYYLSTVTAGAMTTSAPATSGHQVRGVGYALEATSVFFFRPTIDYGEKS